MTPRRPPGEGIGDGLLGGLTHAFKFEGWGILGTSLWRERGIPGRAKWKQGTAGREHVFRGHQ